MDARYGYYGVKLHARRGQRVGNRHKTVVYRNVGGEEGLALKSLRQIAVNAVDPVSTLYKIFCRGGPYTRCGAGYYDIHDIMPPTPEYVIDIHYFNTDRAYCQ